MPNYNTGDQIRFDNGGKIFFGTTATPTDEIINIVPGSVKHGPMPREAIQTKDRGVLGSVIVGDQRPQVIEFQVYRTALTSALLAALKPADTNGAKTLLYVTIRYYDYLGAATGDEWKYTKVYMPDAEDQDANAEGPNLDIVTIRLLSAEGPVAGASF